MAAIVHVQAARSRLAHIGTLGDSYTDEYRFYPPDRNHARNWVELLASSKKAIFGPFSAASRGEPRNAGFATNWARSDATSSDMVRNQLPGLSQQVSQGLANLSVIFIGGNDYIQYVERLATGATPGSQATADLTRVESLADENVTTAVQTLLAANPSSKIVLVSLPDLRQFEAFAAIRALPQIQPYLGAIGDSIVAFNARLAGLAAENPGRVAVADLNGRFQQLLQQAGATGSFSFGGKSISVTTAGDSYKDLFLADGLHLGTVGQGILADLIAQTADSAFNSRIRLLTTSQILQAAKHLPRM